MHKIFQRLGMANVRKKYRLEKDSNKKGLPDVSYRQPFIIYKIGQITS